MVRLWLLDQYDDAELDRKKVAAMFAGFVTRPGPDDVMGEDSAQKGSCTGGSAKALEERGHGMRVMFEVTKDAHHAPRQA
jgi:capsid protein